MYIHRYRYALCSRCRLARPLGIVILTGSGRLHAMDGWTGLRPGLIGGWRSRQGGREARIIFTQIVPAPSRNFFGRASVLPDQVSDAPKAASVPLVGPPGGGVLLVEIHVRTTIRVQRKPGVQPAISRTQ